MSSSDARGEETTRQTSRALYFTQISLATIHFGVFIEFSTTRLKESKQKLNRCYADTRVQEYL
jgi:hypothetical protein